MTGSDYDGRTKYIKYTLLCITAILVLSSAVIITLGTSIYTNYQYVAFFLYDKFYPQAISTTIIGAIILAVSLFGFISALTQSTCLINSFAVTLTLALVLELYAAFVAFNMREMLYWMLDNNLRMFFKQYSDHFDVQRAFDKLQSGSYMDWESVNMTVPYSCCAATALDEPQFEVCSVVSTEGCLPMLYYTAYQIACALGVVALIVAIIQIIGIVMSSFSVAKSIRRLMSNSCEINERLINDYTPIP